MEEGYIRIKEAMELLAPYDPKKQPTINTYCLREKIPARREGELWYIQRAYIEQAICWRQPVSTTEELLEAENGFQDLDKNEQKWCRRKVNQKTAEYLIPEDQYSILFAGRLVAQDAVSKVKEIIQEIVGHYTKRSEMLPAAQAAKQMDMSTFQIKSLIKSGRIQAERVNGAWYVTEEEIRRFQDEKDSYIGLFDIVKELIPTISITMFDIEDATHRYMLNSYVKRSKLGNLMISWGNAELKGDRKNAFYVPAESKEMFKELLIPYLRHYGLSEERVQQLWENWYWIKHPMTKQALERFSENKVSHGMAALLETVIENLDCEIMDATDDDVRRMLDYARSSMTEIYQMYLAQFLKFVKENYKCKFTLVVEYRTGAAHKRSSKYGPYPLEQYYLFAYMNYNDQYIKEHGLVRKAVMNENHAFLWFRCCWHYDGMWRDSDIRSQIPVVHLRITKKELKEKLLSGTFTEEEADNLSLRLESMIESMRESSEKTRKEELRVHFPESLRPVIGLAYACCLVHADGKYIKGMKLTKTVYREFYGDEYTKIFGFNTFLNRRANKSYADMLVEVAERRADNEHKVRGYMLATYARGHVQQTGKVSATTARYLSYKLDGLSDNEVVVMLMEMGTCSFTVNMLLEAVYGEKYKSLPVQAQAEIVKESGLTAYSTELVADAISKAFRRSKKLAREILEDYPSVEGQKKACKDAFVRVIEGEAAAKTNGMSCLNMAFLRPCSEPHCEECLGCENAIMHKGALFHVVRIIADAYQKKRNAVTETTREMYDALIRQKYLPAAMELLTICKSNYKLDVREFQEQLRSLITKGEMDELC